MGVWKVLNFHIFTGELLEIGWNLNASFRMFLIPFNEQIAWNHKIFSHIVRPSHQLAKKSIPADTFEISWQHLMIWADIMSKLEPIYNTLEYMKIWHMTWCWCQVWKASLAAFHVSRQSSVENRICFNATRNMYVDKKLTTGNLCLLALVNVISYKLEIGNIWA